MYFLAKTNDHCHQIQHIGISLGTTFYLKQAILIFFTKFAEKGCFPSKQDKWALGIKCLSTKFQLKQILQGSN